MPLKTFDESLEFDPVAATHLVAGLRALPLPGPNLTPWRAYRLELEPGVTMGYLYLLTGEDREAILRTGEREGAHAPDQEPGA